MGSRDRPHREAKKKPKDKSGQPKLSVALGAAAATGGADPEAAEARSRSRGRDDRRGLIARGPARERGLSVRQLMRQERDESWR